MKKAKPPRLLAPEALRWRCDPRLLRFRTTAEVECCHEIIGQPRALAALRLGLEFHSPGYNVFVAGITGTGKTTAIKRLLDEMHLPGGAPPDLCYVHNFDRPDEPLALQMPAGSGRGLERSLKDLVVHLQLALPALYNSEPYKKARRALQDKTRARIASLFQEFEKHVAAEGFQIVQEQVGPMTRTDLMPLRKGKPVPFEALREAAAKEPRALAELTELERRYTHLQVELEGVLREGRSLERELRDRLEKLDRTYAAKLIRGPIADLREAHAKTRALRQWLARLEDHVLDSLARFTPQPDNDEATLEPGAWNALDALKVNVLVDNSGAKYPPIIVETAPTARNLFGGVERVVDRAGAWRSDHTMIRAGSVLRANGGYLVLNLMDTVAEPTVWPTLKRVLRNMRAEIPTGDPFTQFLGATIKPQPVELDLKVVLTGDHATYQTLYDHDEDFRKIFKVKADFDSTMPRDRRSMHDYATFVAMLCRDEGLLPFDAGGVAAVLETGARLAGRQTKLSTRFSDIADVVREAHYWGSKSNARTVGAAHVDRAVRERIERVNLVEVKLQEAFETGQLILDLRGKQIGQVNALTVYDFGDYVFGRPARITSQVSMGRSGIINIEREANLSGSTHDKAVLILAGYLRGMYAQDKPLTLSASIAFEQSYGGVEGDSATAAEVYALLSAIANLPLRQDLAVTGSIDQKGQLQPVGGINEKIEGFFDVCRSRGLTGTQGVVIPAQNVPELMLRKDVVEAVRKKRFHVYPVRNVDQGLEIMSGLKAGVRRRFRFESNTVHRRVDDALYELAEGIKEFVDGADTPAGGPPVKHGIGDEDGDEGMELARKRRHRPARTESAPKRRRRM